MKKYFTHNNAGKVDVIDNQIQQMSKLFQMTSDQTPSLNIS